MKFEKRFKKTFFNRTPPVATSGNGHILNSELLFVDYVELPIQCHVLSIPGQLILFFAYIPYHFNQNEKQDDNVLALSFLATLPWEGGA